ncbi:phosphatidate cytidylyltransferase [Nannocystis exedens]|uniref:Phosphatidate cytidylyltransferase n=1 Tax=Nannocystis exedens TaxID=54 RepID=A0A1I2F6X1_9BACT|nr:phosphatidate cytidylyltransferase [Nannocystis exedens]PCC73092.1 phosphatidate cytidylyltransferase [Nannocystis exedens]SFF00366.1 phosphatidate cytidylyltransferase [Nannocystis exedens]
MADLIKRLWTAIVLVPILVIALFVDRSPWSILALSVLFGGLALDEYLRMALPQRSLSGPAATSGPEYGLRAFMAVLGAAVVALPMVFGAGRVLPPLLMFSVIAVALALLGRKHALEQAGRHMSVCLAALLYVPLLASVWPQIKHHFGPGWLFVTLAIAFLSDTGAYAFGRLWGKHKLYPAVSPGKTWEGSLGGLVGANVATLGFGSAFLLPELAVGHAIVLGVLGSLAGQVGDLFESMLKRSHGVKDSGNLLPGHGGMLDRVDALLFVGPVVYYFAANVVFADGLPG